MRAILVSILGFLVFTRIAAATTLSDPTDHCASNHYKVTILRSGSAGFLLDTSAWAEAGVCLKFPIDLLTKAAANIDVMTWAGVTRVVPVQPLSLAPHQLMRVHIDYEASHEHFFVCQTAQWPMEWTETLVPISGSNRKRVEITADRVPGGNSNGGYIKKWSVRAELLPVSANETSFHILYEIAAPWQEADWAVGAITEYIDRLSTVASGGKAPGPIIDPDCPP